MAKFNLVAKGKFIASNSNQDITLKLKRKFKFPWWIILFLLPLLLLIKTETKVTILVNDPSDKPLNNIEVKLNIYSNNTTRTISQKTIDGKAEIVINHRMIIQSILAKTNEGMLAIEVNQPGYRMYTYCDKLPEFTKTPFVVRLRNSN